MQLKTQRVSFETYFPPMKKERSKSCRSELVVALAISITMWLGIGYAAWATLYSIFR